MTQQKKLSIAAAAVFAAALCSAMLPAGSVAMAQESAMSTAANVSEQQQNGIAFVNAGAGKEEVAALKQVAGQYPLRVIISGRGGEYGVADRLTVTGPNGVRVEIADAGPWIMLKVPQGSYTLEARFHGHTERRVAAVGAGSTVVNWNTPAASS